MAWSLWQAVAWTFRTGVSSVCPYFFLSPKEHEQSLCHSPQLAALGKCRLDMSAGGGDAKIARLAKKSAKADRTEFEGRPLTTFTALLHQPSYHTKNHCFHKRHLNPNDFSGHLIDFWTLNLTSLSRRTNIRVKKGVSAPVPKDRPKSQYNIRWGLFLLITPKLKALTLRWTKTTIIKKQAIPKKCNLALCETKLN